MEFVLAFHQPADVYQSYADPIKGPAAMQLWKDYMDGLAAEGIMRGGNRLNAAGVTSVSVRDGQRQVQDRAFSDTKSLLGGYVVIDVPSIEDALKWASRSPSSLTGTTEVLPVMATGPNDGSPNR